MICRAAMLRCPGVLATKTCPPVHDARSASGPANAEPATDLVDASSAGLSMDGDDAEDVDRHVDGARERRHLGGRQMAGVVGAVGQHDDRAPTALALADPRRRRGDGVVQRRRAERHDLVDRLGQRLQPGREWRALVEMRIEGVNGRFVARGVQPAEQMACRFARVRQLPSMLPLTSNSTATLMPASRIGNPRCARSGRRRAPRNHAL